MENGPDYRPLVSIVIPTYNRANLITETIQGVLDQTYRNWELIIVDDGSSDNTESVIKAFNSPKITYLKIEHTGILGKVRNHGIQIAGGDYIAFLDSDDLWRNDKLDFQLKLLQQYPSAFFIFSNGHQFGEGAVKPPDFETLFVGAVFRPMLFEGRFCCYMPSLLFKKEIIKKIGMLNEVWKGGGDIDFFYRMSHEFTGIFTNERLVQIRKHNHSISQKFGDLSYIELLDMFCRFCQMRWIKKTEYTSLSANIYYKMALEQYKRGQPKMAVKNFYKHNKLQPFHWKGWVRLLQAMVSSANHKPPGNIGLMAGNLTDKPTAASRTRR